jgi:CDP-glucose 4,6-dehydratase
VPGAGWRHEEDHRLHEAGLLKLDSSKARKVLGWRPRWRLSRALEQTAGWHLAWRSGADARELVLDQIESYEATLAA